MSSILIINASSRQKGSLSRYMTNIFVEIWKTKHSNVNITHRDIGQNFIPHITEKWITAAFKPSEVRTSEDIEILQLSDELITELKRADVIVLGTPMYNWSLPSSLKAYIDQVMRIQETIQFSEDDPKNLYKGLMKNKTVYLLMVRGNFGYDPGEYYEHMDFQTKYLQTVFSIMGVDDIQKLAINGADMETHSLESVAEKVELLING